MYGLGHVGSSEGMGTKVALSKFERAKLLSCPLFVISTAQKYTKVLTTPLKLPFGCGHTMMITKYLSG